MKTQHYNPSPLEQELARAIAELQPTLNQRLSVDIISIETHLEVDNPRLSLLVKDRDGDQHKLVVQIIQRIDDEEVGPRS